MLAGTWQWPWAGNRMQDAAPGAGGSTPPASRGFGDELLGYQAALDYGVIVDEQKLKALLKSLIEEVHYQAVGTHVIANEIKVETHRPIEDINAGFDRLHEMLDEAIGNEEDDAEAWA